MNTSKGVVLEVLTDRKLNELHKSADILYTGKIVTKKDGGFKVLYDLPPTSTLTRLDDELMTDFLRINIKSHGWLCNRNTGWIRAMCALSSCNGLFFVYTKPYKGYAVKLSYAKEMKMSSPRIEFSLPEKSPESCTLKVKWDFGSIEIQLAKNQIEKWRRPLINSFEAHYPCFKSVNSLSLKQKKAVLKNTSTSTEDLKIMPYTEILSTSDSDSWASAVSKQDELFTAIEIDKSEEFVDVALDCVNEETTSSKEITKGSFDRVSELLEFPIELATLSNSSVETDDIAVIKLKFTSCEAAIYRPMYRLETEREKITYQRPPIKITEKVRYFEELDNFMTGRLSHEKKLALIEDDTNDDSSKAVCVSEAPSWKTALMKTPF